MKKALLLLLFPAVMSLVGCSGGSTIMNIAATGKPYEIFVVTEKPVWNGVVGDSLRMVMDEEVLWLNQPESIFDLINITPPAFNDITRRHRNLMLINIEKGVDSTSMTITNDRWATGQVVMNMTSGSDSMAAEYISENAETLVEYLDMIEKNRMSVRAKRYNDSRVEQLIKDKFGFNMIFPRGYKVANDITDFLWLIYDMPIASQGVVIYSFDKPEDGSKLNLVAERNRAVSQIPGPVDGSYMGTSVEFYPESEPCEINGQGWIETRGFWKVEGDWMGGPFINYVTYDSQSGRYIGIDLYVYSPSPKYPKRNYVRQLESLMLGVSFK
ncbi:MAG: DUF4837 family protein [Rikenellaceae bacterium]